MKLQNFLDISQANMSLHYCTLTLILTLLNLSCGIQDEKKSLIFVLDVSATMSDKIDVLRKESVLLLNNLYKWRGSTIENYIMVQCGDEVNKNDFKVIVDQNYVNILNGLSAVQINRLERKSSCAASCYQGLENGSQLAKNDSIVLVFTDGGTKHKELVPKIKKLALQKRLSFYFTLINNDCGQTNLAGDFRDLASVNNGDVFNVEHSKIKKHFEFLAQILTGPPFAPSIEIFVDSTMSEFIITVTSQNAIITIFDPKQKYVSSTRYEMLTNLPTVKMIKVSDLTPGRYTVEIVSETSYSGQVQTKSDLQFRYGFSVNEPNSILETDYAPLKGLNTHLAISPSNASLIENLERVILYTTSGREYKYDLTRKTSQNGDLYVTKFFSIDWEPFKIYVYGLDRKKYRIIRLISPNIEASSADHLIPTVDIKKNITVQESDPFNLIFPGKNGVGKDESKSFATVKQTNIPLHVYTPKKTMDAVIGAKRVELQCHMSHIPKNVNVTWLFNGEPILPEGSHNQSPNLVLFNIEQSFSGTYTCIGQKGAEEMRDNVQVNVKYKPKILNLFNFNTNTEITDSVEINNTTRLHIICAHDGNPTPTVQWINESGDIISNTPELNIRHNDKRSGEFTCQVENDLGKTERKIKIFVTPEPFKLKQISTIVHRLTEESTSIPIYKQFEIPVSNKNTIEDTLQLNLPEIQMISKELKTSNKPIESELDKPELEQIRPISKPVVIQNYNKTNELIEGSSFTMTCPIEIGEYNVTWLLNGKSIDHLKLTNESIYINSVYANMKGDVLCVASNKAGSANASISFDILTYPYDIQVQTTADRTVFINDRYEMKCNAKGHPEPNIYWLRNEQFFTTGNNITFEKVHSSDNGKYICIAENYLGNINKTFILQVSDPPQFANPTNLTRVMNTNTADSTNTSLNSNILRRPYDIQVETFTNKILVLNDRYELRCIVKGYPEPDLYWIKNEVYFKRGDSIAFQKVQTSDRGKYTCVAENHLGSINKTFILQVSTPPQFSDSADFNRATNRNNGHKLSGSAVLKFISVRRNYFEANFEKTIEVDEKERIILNCTMYGDPVPEIKWYKNNVNLLKKSNQSVLDYKKALVSNSGIYKCIGSNVFGQIKAIFYVNVKKPVSILSLGSSKNVYKPGDNIRIKCITSGNPLPTIRIYSKNISTGSDLLFEQSFKSSIEVFQKHKVIYFDGYKIIDENQAASLDRYSTLTYDRYIATFVYIIKSIRPKDAGTYTCTSVQSTVEVHKHITIEVLADLFRPIDHTHRTFNITQNTKLFRLECPVPNRTSNIYWFFGNKRIRANAHLIPNGRILEIREPRAYHTGAYKCTDGVLEFNFKIFIQLVLSPTKFNNRVIKIKKRQSTVLRCSLGSNTIYWFEILHPQNNALKEFILLNNSLQYDIVGDLSRTILCSDEPNPRQGDIFQIIVQQKPTILATKTHFEIRKYTDFRLECNTTGNPQPTIKWYKLQNDSWKNVKTMPEFQATNGLLVKKRADISDEAMYLCLAKNEIGKSNKAYQITILH